MTDIKIDNELHSPVWKRLISYISNGTASTSDFVELLFRVEERGSNISTEIRAGFVHFLSVSVILGVNPYILSVKFK